MAINGGLVEARTFTFAVVVIATDSVREFNK